MAKITTGSTFGLTKQQLQAVEMRAEGFTTKQIAMALFDVRDERGAECDPKKLEKAIIKVRSWWNNPRAIELHRALLKEFLGDLAGRAIQKLGQQLDDKNGWLVNKAANDILSKTGALGDDDKQIVVKVEGMPEIGVPDEEE